MGFTDKTLQCSDCGETFIFTADEQEFHANKGYTNEPKRCPTCREARRSQRRSFNGYRSSRQMYPAICAECGKECEVPFEPREGRPVYCSECYSKMKLSSRL
ncbi:MAG: zinc-ribbon domain containing protein [Dehalococcoidia bacterium]|nr:zinc-ribbon domain containing protein [Dehalococcoidia bacterium]RLC65593.1 MAG: zinc-binding protein [Chloroflexota bacterium]